jgi:hypothetical protein
VENATHTLSSLILEVVDQLCFFAIFPGENILALENRSVDLVATMKFKDSANPLKDCVASNYFEAIPVSGSFWNLDLAGGHLDISAGSRSFLASMCNLWIQVVPDISGLLVAMLYQAPVAAADLGSHWL